MKYRHFRFWELADDETRLPGRLRKCKPAKRGGATAVYSPSARIGGVAVCSHLDQYCRRTGRELATQRATAGAGYPYYPLLDEVMVVVPRLRRGHPCRETVLEAVEWILDQARPR